MRKCNCIEKLDEALKPDHRLDVSIVFQGNALVVQTYTSLIRRDNGRPETRSNQPRIFQHDFCPFCGVNLRKEPEVEECTLVDCPVGLFLFGGELCVKTAYGDNNGRIDAYIVAGGSFFWGNEPQTIASQRAQMVRPVPFSALKYLCPVTKTGGAA